MDALLVVRDKVTSLLEQARAEEYVYVVVYSRRH
jgi:hypothetical protein